LAKRSKVYTGSEWVDLASSATDLSNYANLTTTPISGFRNAIINGDFRINQRGFSSGSTGGTFMADRWYFNNQGGTGTLTASLQTFTPGTSPAGYEGTRFARIVTSGQSAVSTRSDLIQNIEDVRTFAGQTITVSFWAKSASGTPSVSVELGQYFGTGGSPSAFVSTPTKLVMSGGTSWTRYSFSYTVPSLSGKTIGSNNDHYLYLGIWVSAGSDFNTRSASLGIQSNTFDFWGLQIEKGTVATPFEQRPIGTELPLCQRYYEVGVTPAQFMAMPSASFVPSTYRSVYYKINKRISNPVVTVVCTNHDNASGNGTVLGTSDSAFVHYLLVANTSFPYNTAQLNWNSNAEL
jgi:hypothetical protein